MTDRYILPITPQSWVHIRGGKGGDRALFHIPEVCHKGRSKTGCVQFHRTGLCKHTLSPAGRARKKRIERYNKYRLDVFTLAKQVGFQLPICGWSMYFYFPMPKRWSQKKRAAMHGQLHQQKPDQSNLLKAFEDSLSIVDEKISQMSGIGKFWIDDDEGYIEILVNQPMHNPFDVVFINQDKQITMSDIEERRRKRDEERARKKAESKKAKKKKPKPKIKITISQEKLFLREEKLL